MENPILVNRLTKYFLCLCALGFSVGGIAQTSEVRRLIEGPQGDAVMIDARLGTTGESGLGFIVSSTVNHYVVATARHVVYSDDISLTADPVSVKLSNGQIAKAGRVVVDSTNDIAFLVVDGSGSAVWEPRIASFDLPEAGERAWIYDHANAMPLKGEGEVASATPQLIVIKNLEGREGESGAPVFTAKGLIGLYRSTHNVGESEVIPIARLRTLAQAHDVSWDLVESAWSPKSVTLSISVAGTGTGQVKIKHLQTGTTLDFGSHEAYSGRYAVIYPLNLLECKPQTFDIPRTSTQEKVSIRCVPNLNGQWRSVGYSMAITRLGDFDFDFSAMSSDGRPDVPVAGRLQRIVNDDRGFTVTARTGLGGVADGSARLDDDLKKLVIHTNVGTASFDETVERAP